MFSVAAKAEPGEGGPAVNTWRLRLQKNVNIFLENSSHGEGRIAKFR